MIRRAQLLMSPSACGRRQEERGEYLGDRFVASIHFCSFLPPTCCARPASFAAPSPLLSTLCSCPTSWREAALLPGSHRRRPRCRRRTPARRPAAAAPPACRRRPACPRPAAAAAGRAGVLPFLACPSSLRPEVPRRRARRRRTALRGTPRSLRFRRRGRSPEAPRLRAPACSSRRGRRLRVSRKGGTGSNVLSDIQTSDKRFDMRRLTTSRDDVHTPPGCA